MDIVKKIKSFAEEECKKPTNKYGYAVFLCHFAPTVKYARKLADEVGGDKEVILIAAWMHDIGSVVSGREKHHMTGAKIAEKKLTELNYPIEKIKLVKKCILNHRGSQQRPQESIEEQIVSEADVMSNFDNIAGIFRAAFVCENKNQEDGRRSVLRKLKNKWKQIHFEKSKQIIRPKYEAAMLLFK